MYTSKSGKKFGSAFAGRKKDEMDATKEGGEPKNNPFGGAKSVAEKAPAPAMPPKPTMGAPKPPMPAAHEAQESPEFEKGENEGMNEGQEDPKSVVATHGPATSVHVTHDHAAHKHHVTSTHTDGHVHESDHATPEEANQAASTLGGGGGQEKDEQGPPPEGGAPEPDGFSMPSLG